MTGAASCFPGVEPGYPPQETAALIGGFICWASFVRSHMEHQYDRHNSRMEKTAGAPPWLIDQYINQPSELRHQLSDPLIVVTPLAMSAVAAMDTAIPAPIKSGIKETLGCVAVGGIISTAIYGITVLQTYIYFRRYKKDPLVTKLLVGLLFLMDTGTSSLVAYSIYEYMVIYFDQPWEKYLIILPTLGAENGLTVVIATLTQCFFAHRLWAFSKNKFLTIFIVAVSICALGPGIGITVHLFTNNDIFSIGSLEVRILAGFANGLSVICDVAIALGLCYYFQTGKSGFSSTDSMIDRLMLYAIQRGLLTAISQLMHMITTVAMPGRFIFLPFAFMQGKFYCNTLLATLNVRESIRETGRSDGFVEPNSLILASLPRDGWHNERGRSTCGDVGTASMATIEISAKAQAISASPEFDTKV